jgi:putative polyhydroxyalkanoate system protein
MSSISIRRPHSLDHKQAVEVANRVSEELAGKYAIKTFWSGTSMHVKGSGLSGVLKLAPEQFELDIKLGLVLTMFRDKIAAGIEGEFDKLLRVKPKNE